MLALNLLWPAGLVPVPPLGLPSRSASHDLNVYIEDTDAFGVVYHANYARYIERAAHELLGRQACSAAFRNRGALLRLEQLDGVKYTAPALLGDRVAISLTPRGLDANGRLALRAELSSSDGKGLLSCADVRIALLDAKGGTCQMRAERWKLVPSVLLPEEEQLLEGAQPGDEQRLQPPLLESSPFLSSMLEADECDAHGRLSLHATMRYFERHRTQFIGGPEVLAELQASGVQVVVARINGLRLLAEARTCSLGAELALRCRISLRARDTQVIFEQWLLDAGSGTPLARADVTCLCIDGASKKIVAAPNGLRERLGEWAELGAQQ